MSVQNIWADILSTNSKNCVKGIDKLIGELLCLQKAIASKDKRKIEELLEKARDKRAALINYKIKNISSK